MDESEMVACDVCEKEYRVISGVVHEMDDGIKRCSKCRAQKDGGTAVWNPKIEVWETSWATAP